MLTSCGIFLDGKAFSREKQMVVAVGVTIEGEKVILGFVETGSENHRVIRQFFQELKKRGLRVDQDILFIIDGSKGIRKAVDEEFPETSFVQRCQWHKREDIVSYLSEGDKAHYRSALQKAYEKWRWGSNYIASTLINEAFEKGYNIAHGTTSTSEHVAKIYEQLKKNNYKITLLLCNSTDKNRVASLTKSQSSLQYALRTRVMVAPVRAVQPIEPDRAAGSGRMHETAFADVDPDVADVAGAAEEHQVGGRQPLG